jgi:hypothetical protein
LRSFSPMAASCEASRDARRTAADFIRRGARNVAGPAVRCLRFH